MTENKNRRNFFRIYDEVHLFYKKIDEKLAAEPYSIFDDILNNPALSEDIDSISQHSKLLSTGVEKISPEVMAPHPRIRENEKHEVNIGAGGMAFIGEGALKEGDYLIIKIGLASSKTDIVTYGQVVSCEKRLENAGRYAYSVGVHFVDMKDEDRELLIKYVDKKRRQYRWGLGFLLAVVLTTIAAPDMVFGLLFELFHFLYEHLLGFFHIVFEFIELTLDNLVEHFFHTDLQQTQLIVFYILLFFVVYGLYRLWRILPPFCRHYKENLLLVYAHKKAHLLFYWRQQSLFNKIKLIVIGMTVIALYVLFGL